MTAKNLNRIGRNGKRLLCHECGSESHLLRDHKGPRKNAVNCIKDFAQTIKGDLTDANNVSCIADFAQQFDDYGPQENDHSDTDDSDADTDSDNVTANYIEHAGNELQGRLDMRGLMGINEAHYMHRAPHQRFKGVLIDAGAQESTGGRKQYAECLKHVRAPFMP